MLMTSQLMEVLGEDVLFILKTFTGPLQGKFSNNYLFPYIGMNLRNLGLNF